MPRLIPVGPIVSEEENIPHACMALTDAAAKGPQAAGMPLAAANYRGGPTNFASPSRMFSSSTHRPLSIELSAGSSGSGRSAEWHTLAED